MRVEHIADATLILGDCLEVLPTLGNVDAVVTDPPYGIGIAGNPVRQRHAKKAWDDKPVSEAALATMIGMSDFQIIWGGNYFDLPPRQGFLIWDKAQPEDFSLAQVEYAWISINRPAKLFRRRVVSYSKDHPTQKPVELMEWCLGFVPNAHTILDPFAGSGTTGVACVNLGRKFIGIEREPAYFDVMCRRIEAAYAQPRLFDEPKPAPKQEALL